MQIDRIAVASGLMPVPFTRFDSSGSRSMLVCRPRPTTSSRRRPADLNQALMDEANRRWGRATVVPAAVDIASRSAFTAKFEMRSPRYTTRWDEMPVCR